MIRNNIENGVGKFRYARRGSVLGWMHEYKLGLWQDWTETCPERNLEIGADPDEYVPF